MSGAVRVAWSGRVSRPQIGSDSLELRDYGRTIRRRWRVVVVVLLLVTGLSVLMTWQTTPQYSSSTRLFVSTTDSDAAQAYQNGLFATQRVASYADLVPKSRQLADAVVESLGGDGDAAALQAQVTALVVPDTVNLEITAIDPDPVRARDIAQAYAEALSDLVARLETPEGQTNALIRAEIVDNAPVPGSPFTPQPVRNIGLGILLGLLLGVGLAVVRELLDKSVRTPDDLAAITVAPVLGQITVDPQAVRQRPDEALAGTSRWAESFRMLRTNMQYIEVDQDQKVFTVTSSMPREGKTTTAISLGLTLALTNARVALVECDLRRPLIASRLGIDGAVGTTSVLIGHVSLHDAMQTIGDTGLQVLACGPIPPNPSELLESKAMDTLLHQLRADYDIVLLDAPPLLPVTDAAVLAAQTDGALIVVRHGTTTRDQLTHAIERLGTVGAKPLGVVLNLVPSKGAGGAGGYQYGYQSAGNRRGAGLKVFAPDTGPSAARARLIGRRNPSVDRSPPAASGRAEARHAGTSDGR
jgi:tyrosine-protein kinase